MYDIVIKPFLDYSKINYETDTLTLYGIKFKKTTPNEMSWCFNNRQKLIDLLTFNCHCVCPRT